MIKNLFKVMSFTLALSFCFAAQAQDEPEDPYGVKILAPLSFVGKQLQGPFAPEMLAGLDALEVDTGGQTPNGLLMVDNTAQKGFARSCIDYKDLRARGYRVPTTSGRGVENFFITTCGTLDILTHAQPSTESLFQKDTLTVSDTAILPADLLRTALSDVSEKSPCRRLKTLYDCSKKYQGRLNNDHAGFKYEDSSDSAFFVPALKADLDGDGWEDLVINFAYYSQDGSMRNYGQVCVKGTKEDLNASVIPCNPEPEAKP